MAPEPVPVPGVAKALALTPAGGAVVDVECMLLSGTGRLHVTGNLKGLAADACRIALSLGQSRARRYGIAPSDFRRTDAHFHVPGEAESKEGSSAGLALFMALLSAMLRQSLDPGLAFVGEISLSGQLHPVGGLGEKVVAASQAGLSTLFVPAEIAGEAAVGDRKPGPEIVACAHVDEALARVFPKLAAKKRKKS